MNKPSYFVSTKELKDQLDKYDQLTMVLSERKNTVTHDLYSNKWNRFPEPNQKSKLKSIKK